MPYIITNNGKKGSIIKYNSESKKERILESRKTIECIDCLTLEDVDKNVSEEIKKNIYRNLCINCFLSEIEEIITCKIANHISNERNKRILYNFQTEYYDNNLTIIQEGEGYKIVDDGDINPLEFENLKDFSTLITLSGTTDYDYTYSRKIFIPDKIFDVFIKEIFDNHDSIKEIIDNIALNISKPEYLSDIDFKNLNHYNIDYIKYLAKHATYDNISKFITVDFLKETLNSHVLNFFKADLFEVYKYGCKLLGIEPKNIEYISDYNQYFADKIYNSFLKLDIRKDIYIKDFCPAKQNIQKRLNRLGRDINRLIEEKVVNSNRLIEKRLTNSREILKMILKYEKYCNEHNYSVNLPDINIILKDMAKVIAMQYEYQEIRVDLSDILAIDYCVKDLLFKGLTHTLAYTYINEETKKNIVDLIPASPELEYPETREMQRHFVIHYGPTNSGKTYQAIEELKKAKSGVYLGPLRLLALEIQDRLNESGVPCSLLTGEEEDIVSNACHMSSTVEKLNLSEDYDVCVIDECQMINDPERGFAWSKAILGAKAKTIYACMGPEAVNIIIKLIELCGDTYELVEHKRRSELKLEHPIKLQKSDIQKHDALIVFSKKKVLQVSAELIKMGIKTSMIYGNLPYSVRKKQVERFLNGDTDVIVSTNAIGMGINLPVRRIIFMEDKKFNGTNINYLTITDIKQIAGRAGRNRETGFVTSTMESNEFLKNGLELDTPEVTKAYLGFSDNIINIDAELSDILKVWKTINTPDLFKRMNIDRYILLNEKIYVNVSKLQKLKMLSIAFDESNPCLLSLWKKYCIAFEQQEELPVPQLKGFSLEDYENYYKSLELYYAFSKNFGYIIDFEWLNKEKSQISDKINDILVKNVADFQKKCEFCGTPMRWDNPYKICKACYYANEFNIK